ncbi:MAG: GNAT family N-acetyltransferase [Methanomassiliicoccaceae archaeon]|jgi:ribosomal-protein-alanine N-acetyltransferase|nr:GNAT family N-acetyltransferase [Methanomassiliicoccaceae archaeon]
MIIREYGPRDTDRLYEILCGSLDEYFKREMFSYFFLQWPKGQLVACDFTGRPVGFICASILDAVHARIMMFAVDRDHRSMGIGSLLLAQLKRTAIMSGIKHISLEVRPSNMRAIALYQRHGFVSVEILRNYYNDGGDAVRMDAVLQLNI